MVSEEGMVERSDMSKPLENPRKKDGDRGWQDAGFQRHLTHNGMSILVVHEKRRRRDSTSRYSEMRPESAVGSHSLRSECFD